MTGIGEKIDARFYSLMCYIEFKAVESGVSVVNSIRQFCIDSKEIPEMHRELIEISLKYFNEIIKCIINGDKFDDQIYNSASTVNRFVQMKYILKKMQQLT
ncbi:hypothetical protein BH10BAC5_BH10BAC5_20130 [soil metagenome]